MTTDPHRVVIVGGGIAGAAAAVDLCANELDVVVLEARSADEPVEGNVALTPHSIDALDRLDALPNNRHTVSGVRVLAHGRSVEVPFPDHRKGTVVARRDILRSLADSAIAAGADWRWASPVESPILDDGIVTGVRTTDTEIACTVAVIADGALSHVGRSLGTSRRRTRPQAQAATRSMASDNGTSEWLDIAIDMHDRHGRSLPGMAWVFPNGSGHVDIGVGVLSTFRDADSVVITDVLDNWTESLPGQWNIDPTAAQTSPIISGRVPLADSVWPRTGPNWLAIGDAVAMTSPLNGAGVGAALGTAHLCVPFVTEAMTSGDHLALRKYEAALDAKHGDDLRVARLIARGLGSHRLARTLTRLAMWSENNLDLAMRLATSHGRSTNAARLERIVGRVARLVPEPPEHH